MVTQGVYSSISDEGKLQMIRGSGMFHIKIAIFSFVSGGYPCCPTMFLSLRTIKKVCNYQETFVPNSTAL